MRAAGERQRVGQTVEQSQEANLTDSELDELTGTAGAALQQIQDQLGRDENEHARVRFPRGYLRTAEAWRQRLKFMRRGRVRNNIAYTLMLNDIHMWILRRTDLAGTARDMVVKASIVALGSVAEAILRDHFHGVMGARQAFASRAKRLKDEGIIDASLETELCWLWETRNRQHLFELSDSEYDFYSIGDQRRAAKALSDLVARLQANYANVAA
jgi:hypothetical protein